jgi:hypothetical protein
LKFKALLATAVLTALAVTAAVAAPAISSAAERDGAFGADMGVVHELLADHSKIKRTVTNLPNGIRTVTESDDPQVAKEIKTHVASMKQRLADGRVFNVASHTLPTIFANSAKIHTEIEQTPRGVIVTQTSSDPATVAALQGHAGEVSELARGGMVALMRQVMANGGPMGHNGIAMQQGHFAPGMMMRGMMAQGGMMNHAGGPPMMAQMMQRMMGTGGPMGTMQHGFTPPMLQGHGTTSGPSTP